MTFQRFPHSSEQFKTPSADRQRTPAAESIFFHFSAVRLFREIYRVRKCPNFSAEGEQRMSSINRSGRPPVPTAQGVRNQQLQRTGPGVIIRSIVWDQGNAVSGTPIGFTINLVRMPSVKMANLEIVFTTRDGRAVSERLPVLPINGLAVKGIWPAKAVGNQDPSFGEFTLRVKIDNDTATSPALTLGENAAQRVVRRNMTDGWG